MKPDCKNYYNPDPKYLRSLIILAGLSQSQAADQIGVSARTMRYYLTNSENGIKAPYTVQFALENLTAK